MALTTTITPAKIAVALGVSAPVGGSAQDQQWDMWIDDALMLIQDRATSLGVDDGDVSAAKLDYVVRESVVAHVRRPDDATQVTVSIDDGTTSKSYRSGRGRVTILDEWWSMLGMSATAGRAFEVDTLPAGAGSGRYPEDYWWSSPSTAEYLP
jgi:hypothetical protein